MDAAFRADGEAAGALGAFEAGKFARREDLHDSEAGGQAEHSGKLAGTEALHCRAQLAAQRRRIDFTEQTAIDGGGVHRFFARQHCEIGAVLELLQEPAGVVGRIHHDQAQRDSGGRRLLAERQQGNGERSDARARHGAWKSTVIVSLADSRDCVTLL